jgi:hypothetical protein
VFRAGSGDTNTVDAKYGYNFYKDNTNIYEKTKEPPMSAEQDERIREIRQEIDDYGATEINKFVMGVRPLDEYDAFVQELYDRGAQEWVDILNDAEQTYQAMIAK